MVRVENPLAKAKSDHGLGKEARWRSDILICLVLELVNRILIC